MAHTEMKTHAHLSIRRGCLDVIDYEEIYRGDCRFQVESELLMQGTLECQSHEFRLIGGI
jgi:hypothetical protein